MNTKALLASLVLLCVACQSMAQTKPALPPPPPAPVLTDRDDVVRINTNLVQIDATVTKDGKPVSDLKAEDFEIFEDGKRQTITSFAYISNNPKTTPSTATTATTPDRDPSVPATPLKPDDPRRTLAIVVDDLGLSAESMSDVRNQLRKFVAEKLQPHDLVAIIRTGSQIGALQQFTNDKRLLNRAVDQLRWNVASRVGINVLRPRSEFGPNFNEWSYNDQNFYDSLTALKTVVDALAELPGRKAMMVLSDSLPVQSQDYPFVGSQGSFTGYSPDRYDALQRVAERAIRSSVVIYSIDTQGMQPTGITAADKFSGNVQQITEQMNSLLATRSRVLFDRRAGGDLISRQTGGFQVRNSNDYRLDRILEEQGSYYLLGYRPTDETFNHKFHRITAKVKRSGMTLRTRHGFYGYTEDDDVRRPKPKMGIALMSPFAAQDINVNFTALFTNDLTEGSVIRSFLFLDAKDLTFVSANDKHDANIELHGVIFGNNGAVVDQIRHTGVVSLSEKDYEQALIEGIRIRFDMPAKRPGAYQVRVAARDVVSSRLGSAGHVVVVPNLNNKRLAVSGIVLRGVTDVADPDAKAVAGVSPAVRRFSPDSDLYLAFMVYNASIDRAVGQANLAIEGKLFRDGKRVHTYPRATIDASNQTDPMRIFVTRVVRLGADLEPGHYYLRLEIIDQAVKEKPPMAIQWVDFEIVK